MSEVTECPAIGTVSNIALPLVQVRENCYEIENDTSHYIISTSHIPVKVRRFQMVEEIEGNSLKDLRAIPQNTFQDVFQNWKKTFAFQNWKKSWAWCIKSGGEYSEGDKFD